MTDPSGLIEPDTPEPVATVDAPTTGVAEDDAPRPAAADDRLRRALADLDNLRKRFEREVARARDGERIRVASEWLPVLDDLDRALEHASVDGREQFAFLDGLRAVRHHALAVVAGLGFPRFGEVGAPFDPVLHEAVSTVPADAPAGTVVAVVRPGYGTPTAVLRPAGVVVAGP